MSTASIALQARGRQDCNSVLLGRIAGFFFGVRACITLLFFRNDPALGTAVTLGLSFTLLVLSVGHWLALTPIRREHHTMPSPLKWVAVYLALALVSVSWTMAPSIAIALTYWAGMAADVLTVLFLVSCSSGNELLYQLFSGFTLGAMVVAAVAWSLPAMQDLRLGDEGLLHPNAIGFEFAIAVLCSIYSIPRATWSKWAGIFLAITLLRTLSKASIVAFVAAAAYWFIKDTDVSSRTKAKLGLAFGTVLLFSWGLLEAYAEIYSQGAQSETLTGRTLIWATSFDIAVERPWLGHGFYSFRWLMPPLHDFQPWQAHNELLQQFFCYGLVGVIVTVALYWALFRQIGSSHGKLARLGAALLIFALVRGLVDTERFDLSFPLWLLAALSISISKSKLSRVIP